MVHGIQSYGDYEPILVPKTNYIWRGPSCYTIPSCLVKDRKVRTGPCVRERRMSSLKDPMPLIVSPSPDRSDAINTCPPPPWSPSVSLGPTSCYCCQTTLFREPSQSKSVVSTRDIYWQENKRGGPSKALGQERKWNPFLSKLQDPLADDRLMCKGCAYKYFQFPRPTCPSIYRPHFCETYVPRQLEGALFITWSKRLILRLGGGGGQAWTKQYLQVKQVTEEEG